jgi:hypothetical protein
MFWEKVFRFARPFLAVLLVMSEPFPESWISDVCGFCVKVAVEVCTDVLKPQLKPSLMPPRFWRVKVFFNENEGVLQFNCLSLKCLKEDRRDLVLTGGAKVVQP